jgi:hypothetical protein
MEEKMTRRYFRLHVVWAIYVVVAAGSAAHATGSRPLVAHVEATNGVTIGGVPARTRDALFAGDILDTPVEGSALVMFSPVSQATVLPQSSVQFRIDASGRPVGKMSSGTVLARGRGSNTVILKTPHYTVESVEHERADFLVALLPDQRTVIAARNSNIAITEPRSGEQYVLRAGNYIVIDASAAGLPGQEEEKNKQAPGKPAGQATPPPAPSQPPPKPAAKPVKTAWHIGSLSHGASIALILAAAGGAAGAAAAVAATGGPSASPSSP